MKKILLWLTPLLLIASEGDYEYKIALEYTSGGRGAHEETRELPSCPYERCEGMIEVKIVKKDYKKAIEWFNKAIEYKNKEASLEAFKLLYKQIDYKSEEPDKYLLAKMQENFGFGLREYNKLIALYLNDMAQNQQCLGYFHSYEAYKHGYFGYNVSNEKAEKYKNLAHETCPENSIYFLLSK
jgi:TPR repeat protein